MKKVVLVARIFLGLIFFIFGLNGFFNFIPAPQIEVEAAKTFLMGLMATGYFFPVLKITEILCGLCFLSGYFVPLASVVIAPVVIHIALFHRALAGGPPMDVALVIALAIVAKGYWSSFCTIIETQSLVFVS